jgi:hypothetical protein
MVQGFRQPGKLKIPEDGIDPWNAEDPPTFSSTDYPMMDPYQQITRHTISFNPEKVQKT